MLLYEGLLTIRNTFIQVVTPRLTKNKKSGKIVNVKDVFVFLPTESRWSGVRQLLTIKNVYVMDLFFGYLLGVVVYVLTDEYRRYVRKKYGW